MKTFEVGGLYRTARSQAFIAYKNEIDERNKVARFKGPPVVPAISLYCRMDLQNPFFTVDTNFLYEYGTFVMALQETGEAGRYIGHEKINENNFLKVLGNFEVYDNFKKEPVQKVFKTAYIDLSCVDLVKVK